MIAEYYVGTSKGRESLSPKVVGTIFRVYYCQITDQIVLIERGKRPRKGLVFISTF
jgi:hypothetical protein